VLFGNVLTDLKTWSVILSHKGDKMQWGLTVTGFLWGTIPFSLAMIALSAIYIRGFESALAVFEKIFTRYQHLGLTLLLVIVVLLVLAETFFSNLRSLFIFYDQSQQKLNRRIWFIGFIFVVVIPITVKLFSFSILDLFFLFGTFFAACTPVICDLLMWKKKQGMSPIFTIMFATITGWTMYFFGFYQFSVIGSFALALLVTVFGKVYFLFYNKTST
jgi:hypothetical protein